MTREPDHRRARDGLSDTTRPDETLRREARLAAALRVNLKRRKDQRRERGTPDAPGHQPVRDPDTDAL